VGGLRLRLSLVGGQVRSGERGNCVYCGGRRTGCTSNRGLSLGEAGGLRSKAPGVGVYGCDDGDPSFLSRFSYGEVGDMTSGLGSNVSKYCLAASAV
jgi:hypothetical protein